MAIARTVMAAMAAASTLVVGANVRGENASAAAGGHWAWGPLGDPHPPGAGHPIDAFLDTGERSAAGEQRAFLRRLYFGVTGLPPTPEESAAFLTAGGSDGLAREIDRLLASPRYGERWARHWMDAVHFAETHGHDQDRIREHAWPYRDYLIAAFNEDRPYARFVAEQVAGDALFPGDPQALVALGFLAAGPWDESSLRDIREDTLDRQIARYLDRDDMVATTLQTFCSVTIQCARCHDHKFDPIPQKDYYALQAVFAGVDRANRAYEPDPAVATRRRELQSELAAGSETSGWAGVEPAAWKSESTLTRQPDGSLLAVGTRPDRDSYVLTLGTSARGATAIRLEALADPSLPKQGPGRQDNGNFHLSEFVIRAGDRPLAVDSATASFNQEGWAVARALDGDDKTAWGIHPSVGKSHWAVFVLREPLPAEPITIELRQLHGSAHLIGRIRLSIATGEIPAEVQLARLPPPALVYAAASQFEPDGGLVPGGGVPRSIHVLVRGEITKPAEAAEPGGLTCVNLPFPATDITREENRRAALARWLTSPQNPLLWRSIVNRVWHWHFGRGLVATPNDFGRMGGAPENPELLDWLARWFRDEAGGSIKKLHRLILTSAAYRTRFSPRRLDAEEVRDAMLQIAGRLDLRMGGPSDRYFALEPGVHVTPRIDYSKSDADSSAPHRRSVYRFLFRTLPDPWMEALDCPAGDQLTPDRNNSVTVQQALALWNSSFVARQSERFAARLAAEAGTPEARVRLACELAFNRLPTDEELSEFLRYAERHGVANLCRVLFNSDEFIFVR